MFQLKYFKRAGCEKVSKCIFDLRSYTTVTFSVTCSAIVVVKRFQNVSLTRSLNNECISMNKAFVVKRFQNVSLTRTINNIDDLSWYYFLLVVKRFQNVSLTRTLNNDNRRFDYFVVVKRFQNVSLTRTINNNTHFKPIRRLCCEKVSKCIFDKNDKQPTCDIMILNCCSCEKVSKCIFDKNDKQQSYSPFNSYSNLVVKRFQNVSLTKNDKQLAIFEIQ